MLKTPTITIKYKSKKTENEVYSMVLRDINEAITIFAYDPSLLRKAELKLQEALALVKNYEAKLVLNCH